MLIGIVSLADVGSIRMIRDQHGAKRTSENRIQKALEAKPVIKGIGGLAKLSRLMRSRRPAIEVRPRTYQKQNGRVYCTNLYLMTGGSFMLARLRGNCVSAYGKVTGGRRKYTNLIHRGSVPH